MLKSGQIGKFPGHTALSDDSYPLLLMGTSWEKSYVTAVLNTGRVTFTSKVWKKMWAQALFEEIQVAFPPSFRV